MSQQFLCHILHCPYHLPKPPVNFPSEKTISQILASSSSNTSTRTSPTKPTISSPLSLHPYPNTTTHPPYIRNFPIPPSHHQSTTSPTANYTHTYTRPFNQKWAAHPPNSPERGMREEGENPPDLLYLPRARNTISTIAELRGAGRLRIRLVQDTKRGGRGGRRKGRREGRAGMEWETGEERRVKGR